LNNPLASGKVVKMSFLYIFAAIPGVYRMAIERIIFIDDDKVNNSLSRIIARQAIGNFDILTFEKPLEALEFLEREYLSKDASDAKVLVMLDINMPVMNGWNFLEKVAAYPETAQKNLKIYILSSSIDPRDKQRAESHFLVHGYISKPLGSGILRDLIEMQELKPSGTRD
jgi:CheY-like chemotaxis protein